MLKFIDPVLGPDLLATLRAMGHGDDIAIVERSTWVVSSCFEYRRCKISVWNDFSDAVRSEDADHGRTDLTA